MNKAMQLTIGMMFLGQGCGEAKLIHKAGTNQLADAWNAANNPQLLLAQAKGFETVFNKLPLTGRSAKMPWSGDYWPNFQGGISYRWNSKESETLSYLLSRSSDQTYGGQLDDNPKLQKYRRIVYGYTPPTQKNIDRMTSRQRTKLFASLSPAEKYDIFRGRFDYPTLYAERERTKVLKTLRNENTGKQVDPEERIQRWFGLCHAWAPATMLFNEPDEVSEAISADGYKMTFASADIKALLSYMLETEPTSFIEDGYVGERCDNSFLPELRDLSLQLAQEIIPGNLDSIYDFRDGIYDLDRISELTKLEIVAHALAFAPSLPDAEEFFNQELWHFRETIEKSQAIAFKAHFKNAGKAAELNLTQMLAKIEKAIFNQACNDTNAGAFHMILANIMGLNKKTFGLDKTRSYEVWNQAAAAYTTTEVGRSTGSAIHEGAAALTVETVEVLTEFLYTSEIGASQHKVGNDRDLAFYHVPAGDDIKTPDGIVWAYHYKLELDKHGRIIGGTWLSQSRPDFLWNVAKAPFPRRFKYLKQLYEMATLK